ncbi:MFS transporter [Pseudonocardia sp. ICBG1122]|nr:MFS transporter [Pseudonocardia pini]
MIGVLLFAPLSDRYGRKPVIIAGTAASMASVFAVFPLLDSGTYGLALAAVAVMMLLQAVGYVPVPILLAEIFPTAERYSGVSFSYQLSSLIAGGLTPIIGATLLLWAGGPPNSLSLSLYLLGLCVLTIIGLAFLPNTGGEHDVRLDDPATG